ncbi:MAG: 5-formyltetrahydrofolate cyclo-ligase [Immundisolibacter sp.]|uniref:5-formyltetrahydrofolate cyclo-ligase n=2 Tax=Immundisolibacter sp. TaxID=1934948 RepID=UPI003D14A9AD
MPALRRQLRAARRRIGRAERRAAAAALVRRLVVLPTFQRARRVAAYWPADGEIDPLPALARAHATGKACYLPVLCPLRDGHLHFAPWRPGDPLVRNRYGIPEPVCPRRMWLAPRMLDLVLLPLVGFDATGSRLGMGGGYYDRSFARVLRHAWRRPRLIGVAFDRQRVAALPGRPWDVPLDGVLTPQAACVFGVL